jgi:peptide deformylase
MAILSILKFPNPLLRKKSEKVTLFDSQLKKLAHDMIDTMYDAPGVGLAAIQIGQPLRLLVLDSDYSIEPTAEGLPPRLINKNPKIFVNPVVLYKDSKEVIFEEGCLSVPGVNEEVKRAESIVLSYQSIDGEVCELNATGFLSVIIQHEIDHLDGRLFVDRLGATKRELIVSKYKKGTLKTKSRNRYKVEL